ncbi:MAG: hypothetical protein GXO32_05975 [Crenarchaeota archaeon]|nr:hypothetical protein [Thermoproteota archaeon]
MGDLEIPEWFFESASLRVAWLDLVEGWLYLEVRVECPNCLNVEESTWLLTVGERELLRIIRCGRCGADLGSIVLRELDRFLAEVDSLLRRVEEERGSRKAVYREP